MHEKLHELWDAICTSVERVAARLRCVLCTDVTVWPKEARGEQINFAGGAQKAAMFVQQRPYLLRRKTSTETSGSSRRL